MAAANIWECPNLAQLDGQWVLMHLAVALGRPAPTSWPGCAICSATWSARATGLQFKATGGGVLDDGPAFYAPQVMVDGDRTLLWGWAWELGRSEERIADSGWAGVLTFPRELYVRDGRLCARPAAELTGLRQQRLELVARAGAGRAVLRGRWSVGRSPCGWPASISTRSCSR